MARTSSVRGGMDSFPAGGVREKFRASLRARLLPSEAALRRTVLLLISVFFALTVAGTTSHILYGKSVALAEARDDLGLIADSVAARYQLSGTATGDDWQNALAGNLPPRATLQGRIALIANTEGRIKATAPYDQSRVDRAIEDVIGSQQPLMAFAAEAGVLPVVLRDGREAIVTVRNIEGSDIQLAMFQPQARALESWWHEAVFDITIFATTGLLLILIIAAFLSRPAAAATSPLTSPLGAFDHVLGATGCGLWDWNIARGHVRWSQSMFTLLGLPPSDEPVAFRDIAKAVQGNTDLYAIAERAMTEDASTLDENFRIRNAAGDWIDVRLAGRLVRDEASGEPHLIAAVSQTDKAGAAGKWSESSDVRLRDAIESISEAFVLWDSDNRLVLCNSKYQQFHDLPDSSVIPGTPYEQVLSAASEPPVLRRIDVAGDGASHAQTYEVQLQDNRWLHVDERRTKDGGYVCVSVDITNLKQNEQKLFEHDRELQASVSDLHKSRRELELQKQQLVDLTEKYALEKNRAEAANRSKSQFLANFSHELRTPLNAVLGFSDVMQQALFGPLGNEKYEEYARDIHESGSYLLEVINDILDMSKIEAGRIQLEIEQLDLGEIVEDSFRVVAESAKKRQVKLKRTGLDTLKIEADRRALKQILLNLLSNAVKFTPEGGEVRIRLARGAKGRVKIIIKDTGIGIPARELDKLGKPFEQIDNQFTKSHKGSGLGLSISRSLIEMHGGLIEITSKEGQGTTVTCILPTQPMLRSSDLTAEY